MINGKRMKVCNECASVCHKGHKLSEIVDIQECECGSRKFCSCRLMPPVCTRKIHGTTASPQMAYKCKTCNSDLICESCSRICHTDHEIEQAPKGPPFVCGCKLCSANVYTVGQDENLLVSRGEPNTPIDVGKVVLIGPSNSGKTAIFERLGQNKFSRDTSTAVGIGFKSVIIEVDGQQVNLQVSDSAGSELFRPIAKAHLRNAAGVVLVFDITDRKTFDDINMRLNDVHDVCGKSIPMILIGNKGDLSESRVVTLAEAEQFAQRHKLTYIEASARDGTNVREAFASLARSICIKFDTERTLRRT